MRDRGAIVRTLLAGGCELPFSRLASLAQSALGFVQVPGVHPDPRHIVVGLGLELLPRPARVTCGEAASMERVAYERSDDSQAQGLDVFHGLAHVILWEEHDLVSEPDAWALTALLAVPIGNAEFATTEMAMASPHVPGWFVLAAIGAGERELGVGRLSG